LPNLSIEDDDELMSLLTDKDVPAAEQNLHTGEEPINASFYGENASYSITNSY